jgi:hypothetical protein
MSHYVFLALLALVGGLIALPGLFKKSAA